MKDSILATQSEINSVENQSVILLESGKMRRAEKLLKRLLADDPASVAAHFNLARIYWRIKQNDLALQHALQTLKHNPNEPNANLNLGLIYDLMGQANLAFRSYKRELTRNPGSAETHWNLGRLYFKRNQWSRASKHLRACFNQSFRFEIDDTIYKLGYCYHKLNALEEYIAVYSEFVAQFPQSGWAFANLGRALLKAKDYKKAALKLIRAKQLGNFKNIDLDLAKAKKRLQVRKLAR